LKYVSTTRAKEALFLVTDEKPIEVKPEPVDDGEDETNEEEEDDYDEDEIRF
jgi:hypothetical protein